MTATTIILLLVSILIAAGLSFYQYFYKAIYKSKVILLLAFLRFFSILGLFVLLINPIITRKSSEVVKTPLPIIIDNSSSITNLKANETALEVFKKLSENEALNEKFELQTYQFDTDFATSDTIDFKGNQTNIDVVAKNLKSIYKNQTFPTVLITDGNQTSGEDYVFGFNPENKVYPLVVGDTTTYLDLKIAQLNVNKYAFHKNKFPVEVFLNYAGTKSITANIELPWEIDIWRANDFFFTKPKVSSFKCFITGR